MQNITTSLAYRGGNSPLESWQFIIPLIYSEFPSNSCNILMLTILIHEIIICTSS